MADLYGGEVIHRVRAELVPHRRELKLYVLCRCGRGAWLASMVPSSWPRSGAATW